MPTTLAKSPRPSRRMLRLLRGALRANRARAPGGARAAGEACARRCAARVTWRLTRADSTALATRIGQDGKPHASDSRTRLNATPLPLLWKPVATPTLLPSMPLSGATTARRVAVSAFASASARSLPRPGVYPGDGCRCPAPDVSLALSNVSLVPFERPLEVSVGIPTTATRLRVRCTSIRLDLRRFARLKRAANVSLPPVP
jgi:hypothetical protein